MCVVENPGDSKTIQVQSGWLVGWMDGSPEARERRLRPWTGGDEKMDRGGAIGGASERERVGGGGWLPAAAVRKRKRKRKTNVGRGREGKGWNGRACCAFSFFFFFFFFR